VSISIYEHLFPNQNQSTIRRVQFDATLSFASTTHPTMNPPSNPPQAQGKTDQHFSKRTLRPAASLPTTAETYGEKHGIDPNLTLALQNIGRKGRQSESLPYPVSCPTSTILSGLWLLSK
jgi:hypothetical protein